jgi:hypothetical protein
MQPYFDPTADEEKKSLQNLARSWQADHFDLTNQKNVYPSRPLTGSQQNVVKQIFFPRSFDLTNPKVFTQPNSPALMNWLFICCSVSALVSVQIFQFRSFPSYPVLIKKHRLGLREIHVICTS